MLFVGACYLGNSFVWESGLQSHVKVERILIQGEVFFAVENYNLAKI